MKYFVYCRKSSEEDDRQIQSIESQKRELSRLFSAQNEIQIVETLTEAQSAMTPGRPVFTALLDRIERGEAEGIIAWAPDRLARNSIDGGRVIYLLDNGKLKDLKFATFNFENTPSGKFMLSILFGQSKYYSDALSENVRRGIRTKIENGWLPNMAKIGYLNDPITRTIVADPVRLPLIRELWELALSGASRRQIRDAMEERGLRTLPRKREGGRPLSLSAIYKILMSPFYAGRILWKGRLYSGKHPAIVTLDEYDAVQRILHRPTQARRPKKLEFAFTGLIRCGECGFSVTAERKVNRYGSSYVYYHCSKRRPDYRCKQKSVEREDLEYQIEQFLLTLRVHPDLHQFALDLIKRDEADAARLAETEANALQEALGKNAVSRRNLTKLRIAEQISQADFEIERQELEEERFRLESRQAKAEAPSRFEPTMAAVWFSIYAAKWFRNGDDTTKRTILQIAGSNPILMDRKVNIDAAKLFRPLQEVGSIPSLRAGVRDVRTLVTKNEDAAALIVRIRELIAKVEPNWLKEAA